MKNYSIIIALTEEELTVLRSEFGDFMETNGEITVRMDNEIEPSKELQIVVRSLIMRALIGAYKGVVHYPKGVH